MKAPEKFYHPELSVDYFRKALVRICQLPTGAVVFFDIDGTALQSANQKTLVRKDFHNLFLAIRKKRPDLMICSLSYRSKESGIPELKGYHFDCSLYSEDMKVVLATSPPKELAQAIIDFLSTSGKFANNRELMSDIFLFPVLKLKFLIVMFQEELHNLFLLDDGEDGRIAEILGIGQKVGS